MRPCRQCLTTQEEARHKFQEHQFTLRDPVSHKSHCELVEGPSISGINYSKEYGINHNSVLNTLSYFHVCNGGLVPDVMHDLLEGALQYEVKLMLRKFILDDGYFTLEHLNDKIENMELGYMESKDRPSSIADITLKSQDSRLTQAAAQMLLLAKLLPLAIGDRLPTDDDRWMNFLRMREIISYLFCPNVAEDDAAYLQALISDHHTEFCHIYPGESVIPKMHFMVHMPRLMLQYGPLVRHWTMRYEAKHSYFKHLAQSMGNFINIEFSLATRHQLLQCYLHTDKSNMQGSKFVVGPGKVACPEALNIDDYLVTTAFEAKWITANGHTYKKDAVVLIGVSRGVPKFGKITAVYLVNEQKWHSKSKL